MSAQISEVPARRHLPILSNSEIRTFRRCAREHHFAYRLLCRPLVKAAALRFGTLLHVGLEAWWKVGSKPVMLVPNGATVEDLPREGGQVIRHDGATPPVFLPGDPTPAQRFEAAIVALRAAGESDEFDLVKAEELMLGYTARWGEETFDVLSVEAQFETALVNPKTQAESRTFMLGGKLDVVVGKNGHLSLMEHKSSSEDISLGASYWRRVSALDSQISTYMPGARSLGYDVKDCIYDVIGKLQQRPKLATPLESRRMTKKGLLDARQRDKDETVEEFRLRVREAIAEAPEKYYARGTVVRLEADERDHAFDTWQLARLIREAEIEERHPRNPDACIRYKRECDYFSVCSGEASIDDDTRYRTASSAHEELAVEEIQTT